MIGLERTYALLLRAYPRSFRDEYGSDMQLLLEDQLRDEAAARVWARTFVDLSISVPARHVEAHLSGAGPALVPALFAGISVAGVVGAVLAGSAWRVGALSLAIAVLAGVVSATGRRQTQSVGGPGSGSWWKLLVAGVTVIAGFAVVTSTSDVVDTEAQWRAAMIVLAAGVVLSATGLVRAVAHLGRRTHVR